LQSIPVLSHISGNTASEECFDRARKWLGFCVKSHTSCKQRNSTIGPRRLLDLRAVDAPLETGFVRLIEADQSSPEPTFILLKYACLSHCWGSGSMMTTKSTNISNYKQGIQFNALPKTFQEAIIAVKRLDVSYIWIDSLCIIQDSLEDWAKEANRMAGIYSNAYLTLAASKATGPEDGCFSVTPRQYLSKEFEVIGLENKRVSTVYVRKPINHTVWPLLKRGWVFQERFLSKRVLHFTGEEIVWECREQTLCECSHALTAWSPSDSLDSKSALDRHFSSVLVTQPGDIWRDIIARYTKLNLTFQKDILPALSGLAENFVLYASNITIGSFMKLSARDYCAGLWRQNLRIDLLWCVYINTSNSRPQHWRAPSWSWASTLSSIRYQTLAGRRISSTSIAKTYIHVQSVHCTPMVHPYGELSSGNLTLRGLITAARPYYDSGRLDGPYLEVQGQKGVSPQWDDPVVDRKLSVDLGPTVFLLKMATTNEHEKGEVDEYEPEMICLVLKCLDEKGMTFERAGFLSTYWPKEKAK